MFLTMGAKKLRDDWLSPGFEVHVCYLAFALVCPKCSSKFDLIDWYGIVKSKFIMTSIILPEACFRRMAGHSPSGLTPSRMNSSNDDR